MKRFAPMALAASLAQRGINSIQLYNDGTRWWIVNLVWRGEDDKLQLPARYLSSH